MSYFDVKFANGFILRAVKGDCYDEVMENAIEEMEARNEVHDSVVSITRNQDNPND